MCVVGTITGFGVLLIVAKTIAQALTSPQLVDDREHSPGLTVSSSTLAIKFCKLPLPTRGLQGWNELRGLENFDQHKVLCVFGVLCTNRMVVIKNFGWYRLCMLLSHSINIQRYRVVGSANDFASLLKNQFFTIKGLTPFKYKHTYIHRVPQFWRSTVCGSATSQAPSRLSWTSSSLSTSVSSSWSASSSPSRPAKSGSPF